MPFGWPIADSALFYLCWMAISFSLMPWALAERRRPEVAAPGQPAFILALGASVSSVFITALAGWSDWLAGLHPLFCVLLLALWVMWGAYGLWRWWSHIKRDGARIARQTHALILALALAPILLVMAAAAGLPQTVPAGPAWGGHYLTRLFQPIFGSQAASWLQLSFLVTTGLMLYGLLRQATGRLGVAVVTAFLFITLPANFALVSTQGSQQALACLTLAGLGLFFKDDLPRSTALKGVSILLAGAAALDPAGMVIAACALPAAWIHYLAGGKNSPARPEPAGLLWSALLVLAVTAPVLVRAGAEGAPVWPWLQTGQGSLAEAWRASWAVEANRLAAGNTPVLWLLLPVALVAALRYPRQMPAGWLALAISLALTIAVNLALGRTAYLELIHPVQAALMLWLGAGFKTAYPAKRAALFLLLFGLAFLLPQLPWLTKISAQSFPVFLGWG